MGCFSRRQKETRELSDEKWDHINLADFKAKGMGPGFAYFWLWAMLAVSVAVYALDSFTAVNLLIFDQWSSKIEPGIPLNVSKWIFSICIILSFVNLAYEAFRAYRVIRRSNVADCYLDPLAVRWESIRIFGGQGYRRFLVFAELTKSNKGGQYVALFTYFSLQAWIRVLICSGPRQVINAFTFKSVYESRLAVSSPSVEGSFSKFFEKIKSLAEEDYQQALVLGSMAFTFVVWVFSFIFLVSAVLCYVTFLCHWIPRSDGGLNGYCERKVNQTLKRIVREKVNKALAKGEVNQARAELKAAQKNGEIPAFNRQATLPTLPNVMPVQSSGVMAVSKSGKEDSLPEMPMLNRVDTGATLPPYTSRPASPRGIEMNSMNSMNQRRLQPTRTPTMASTTTDRSYASDASLLSSAADMGRGRPASPAPSVPDITAEYLPPPGPGTPGTPASQRTFGARPGMGHMATDSDGSMRRPMTNSPGPMRPGTGQSTDSFGRPANGMDSFSRAGPTPQPYDVYGPPSRTGSAAPNAYQRGPAPPRQYQAYNPDGRASPAPSVGSHRGGTPGPRHADGMAQYPQYQQPTRSATGPMPPRGPYGPPQRNMTAPMPPRGPDGGYYDRPSTPQSTRGPSGPQVYERPGTSQSQRGGPYGYDYESQRNYGHGY